MMKLAINGNGGQEVAIVLTAGGGEGWMIQYGFCNGETQMSL